MSEPDSKLEAACAEFAAEIEVLLNGTLTESAIVSYTRLPNGQYLIAPGPPNQVGKSAGLVPVSLERSEAARQNAPIWLKVFYTMLMDPENVHPAVQTSMFGWCVNPSTAYCPLRVEYDRNKSARQACHIQVDGESHGWAFGMGRLGRYPDRLDKLHLPMGGRRFRPSLEDFIEFLIQERMVPAKRKRWTEAVAVGRTKWEARQTGATVRRDPVAAAKALTDLGWSVRPPRRRPVKGS